MVETKGSESDFDFKKLLNVGGQVVGAVVGVAGMAKGLKAGLDAIKTATELASPILDILPEGWLTDAMEAQQLDKKFGKLQGACAATGAIMSITAAFQVVTAA